MSAALQLPVIWGSSTAQANWQLERAWVTAAASDTEPEEAKPSVSLAFYRKHTEKILRRYLYASMQVGRTPAILADPVGRGWASSRPIRTFEDAIIFVLDVERCLDRLNSLDRQMLSRVVLQEYTQAEAAQLLGMSVRAMSYKLPQAIDRLTVHLLDTGLLVLPD
ncbi:MAG TPA: sigma factor-like helix-turn-helix DNA-binding protein [Terracidiphilus sp.]|jgi:DNA-directed RNA polymerase specialized sigma24 family protein|nr:sigma factor-like helix-turn-helix DNA-binding protein [Terracidiphilus sp.]